MTKFAAVCFWQWLRTIMKLRICHVQLWICAFIDQNSFATKVSYKLSKVFDNLIIIHTWFHVVLLRKCEFSFESDSHTVATKPLYLTFHNVELFPLKNWTPIWNYSVTAVSSFPDFFPSSLITKYLKFWNKQFGALCFLSCLGRMGIKSWGKQSHEKQRWMAWTHDFKLWTNAYWIISLILVWELHSAVLIRHY